MVKKKSGILTGMLAICRKVNRSESTVQIWIRDQGFPAIRNKDNVWEAEEKAIEGWLKSRSVAEAGFSIKGRQKKKGKGAR